MSRQQQALYFIDEEFDKEKINNLLSKITIKQIVCGYCHVILLDSDNNIYTWGQFALGNSDGQLGLGHKEYVNDFEKVNDFNNNVKLIAAGGYFTMIVTLQNEIYGAGKIMFNGMAKSFMKIEKPKEVNEIKKIKCGVYFTIIMNEKNELFGYGTTFGANEFIKIELPYKGLDNNVNIIDFNCGNRYSVVLLDNGDVYYSELNNDFKTFTNMDLNFNCKQIGGIYNYIYFLSENNELYVKMDRFEFTVKKMNCNLKIKKIFPSLGYTLFILTENNLIYTVEDDNIEKLKEIKYYLPYSYIYPAHRFSIVLNSSISLDEEESKDQKRMKILQFINKQQCEDLINSCFRNNKNCNIVN